MEFIPVSWGWSVSDEELTEQLIAVRDDKADSPVSLTWDGTTPSAYDTTYYDLVALPNTLIAGWVINSTTLVWMEGTVNTVTDVSVNEEGKITIGSLTTTDDTDEWLVTITFIWDTIIWEQFTVSLDFDLS